MPSLQSQLAILIVGLPLAAILFLALARLADRVRATRWAHRAGGLRAGLEMVRRRGRWLWRAVA